MKSYGEGAAIIMKLPL